MRGDEEGCVAIGRWSAVNFVHGQYHTGSIPIQALYPTALHLRGKQQQSYLQTSENYEYIELMRLRLIFGRYAITVVFKNIRTLGVP